MIAHLFVMYPTPKDPAAFERAYREEHLPYAGPRLQREGATGVVSKRVVPAAGKPLYHVVSDVSFPSLEALQACAGSQGGKEALAHAASISTGGPPIVMIATDLV
ncbi:MAG TPA: EthD family reductase [Anaeromyxobacteraceae bacterium]|nr:EthD family reductase [Anaeromyxobacteraceae bacterium]